MVASLETHSYSSSLSLYVRAGSRFETYHQQGLTQLLRNAAFLVSWGSLAQTLLTVLREL